MVTTKTNMVCLLCCLFAVYACQPNKDSNEKTEQSSQSYDSPNSIIKIEFRSRSFLQRVRYPIPSFPSMWKAASQYQKIFQSTDTLRLIDSLLSNLSTAKDGKASDLQAGMLIQRRDGSVDTLAIGGGITYKTKLYSYEDNAKLLEIIATQLPTIDSLFLLTVAFPHDKKIQEELDTTVRNLYKE